MDPIATERLLESGPERTERLTVEEGVAGVWLQHIGTVFAAGVGLCWDRPMAGQCLRNVIYMVHLQTALIFHK